MKETTELGLNRTGMSTSPFQGSKMEEDPWKAAPPDGDAMGAMGAMGMAQLRMRYSEEAGPLGSVPPPSTLKGLANMALQKGMGRKPTLFIDKLGERLAFERGGTRLYEALIAKFESGAYRTGPVPVEGLRAFHDQELQHFHLVWESIRKIGGDPTVMTPCADLVAVESMGLIQSLTDPRTTFTQGLNAILTAELVDNEGWRLLVELADGMNQKEMADAFRRAWHEEDIHLEQVRGWIDAMIKAEANISDA